MCVYVIDNPPPNKPIPQHHMTASPACWIATASPIYLCHGSPGSPSTACSPSRTRRTGARSTAPPLCSAPRCGSIGITGGRCVRVLTAVDGGCHGGAGLAHPLRTYKHIHRPFAHIYIHHINKTAPPRTGRTWSTRTTCRPTTISAPRTSAPTPASTSGSNGCGSRGTGGGRRHKGRLPPRRCPRPLPSSSSRDGSTPPPPAPSSSHGTSGPYFLPQPPRSIINSRHDQDPRSPQSNKTIIHMYIHTKNKQTATLASPT